MSSDISVGRERRLGAAMGLNLVIVGVQVVAGVMASSLGLLADAGHNVTDVAALVVALVAVRLVRRRPTASRSFGYHRGAILAAQLNAASILVVCGLITFEAARRFVHPVPVQGGLVVIVALVSAAANFAAARALGEGGHAHGHPPTGHDHGHDAARHHDSEQGDLNMRAALLHLVGDGVASLGVAAAGAVILLRGGWFWLDPLVSIGISVLIGVQGWKLLRETADVLLESTPAGLDLGELAGAMGQVEGVEAVHDLHVWTLSNEVRALSAHVVLHGRPSLEEAQVVGGRIKARLAEGFNIAHATLELESDVCGPPTDYCAIDDQPLDRHHHAAP
jgi:cobalt-zinc-cadmium efflux system protein